MVLLHFFSTALLLYFFAALRLCEKKTYHVIKAPHWYVVQGSDTTMMPKAASLPGQKPLHQPIKKGS